MKKTQRILKFAKKFKRNILPENLEIVDTFEGLQGVHECLKNLNCFGEDCDMKNDEKLQDFGEKDLENFKTCEKIEKIFYLKTLKLMTFHKNCKIQTVL